VTRIRIALLLILLGLAIEGIDVLSVRPITFLAFLFVGAPLVMAGVVIFALRVLRTLEEKGAL
jgi:hypothetical protein